MQIFRDFQLHSSFAGNFEKVLASLFEEFLVCYFFGVLVPIPDLHAMSSCISNDGFLLEEGLVAKEDGVFCIKADDLEFVDLRHVEKGAADFCFRR